MRADRPEPVSPDRAGGLRKECPAGMDRAAEQALDREAALEYSV